jgi:hypothetical protein
VLLLKLYALCYILMCQHSTFVGLGVMILLFPIPGYFAQRIQAVQVERMKKTDARVQMATESTVLFDTSLALVN